ncbi:VOC family protein [Paracoccus homiensis]|uniref:Glyoxalase-like domain-containing protein n=1 Tax=Paracoccus homiensis TaxID=364199 RepID=A0A1I0IPS5_9RHOB|nr:VOC family protein [Paracoccus homiensis]SET99185.1 Glyoxalase-like domain-containing protein [Paracoccus homiensis]
MTSLGIDHPLVCVRNLAEARETYLKLGFLIKPPGMHPWGTSTALVIFRNQLLELVGIGDESLLDGYPAGDFRFGRHVQHWLEEREGVPLSALNSSDAAADEAVIVARGGHCEGTIEFGRDVVRDDGMADRTATTLKIFTRPGLPRLSMFACQQHRRDLIEFPQWMDHPNGAHGFVSATILARRQDQPAVQDWLATLHGPGSVTSTAWGFDVATAKGHWRVLDREAARAVLGLLPDDLAPDGAPSVISLDVACQALDRVRPFVETGGFAAREIGGALVLTEPSKLGGILLTFQEAPAAP